MMNALENISVIVPLKTGEDLWRDLLSDLAYLPQGAEVILVGSENLPEDKLNEERERLAATVHFILGPSERAPKLNLGAKKASNNFLWFLHADCKLPRPSIHALRNAITEKPSALHFFSLGYLEGGPRAMRFSEMGAKFRSGVLQLPFGDQGYCINKYAFFELGGFDESLTYGEDHDFIWKAHVNRVSLNEVDGQIFTSARKYRNNGWGFTTARQLINTCKVAAPSCIKWVRGRINL